MSEFCSCSMSLDFPAQYIWNMAFLQHEKCCSGAIVRLSDNSRFSLFISDLRGETQPCVISNIFCILKTLLMQKDFLSVQTGKDNHHLYAAKMMLKMKYVFWIFVVDK